MSREAGEPFDDRADAYRRSGDMLAAMARSHSRIEVDDLTVERWRQLMGLMREVDTWADDTDVSHGEVLEGLERFDLFCDRYPALAPGELPQDAHAALLRRTERILKVGQMAAMTTSVRRFMAFRITEARETVNMVGDTATPQVSEQSQFEGEFLPKLRALGEAATLWDSLIDGRQDVKEGKQLLCPNAEYYARLTGAMLRRVKLGGVALLHVEPNRQLVIKAGERIRNRLANGIPDYSTLDRFKRKNDTME